MERKEFLRSRLETKENIFNLTIPFREEHKFIFDRINEEFSPRAELTEDIRDLVTGKLNVCRQRNILIFFKDDMYKLTTLKLFCLMNFIVNWKTYNNYIPNIVYNNSSDNTLSYKSSSLEAMTDMRFRDIDREELSTLYNVDILFLTVNNNGTNLFKNDFCFDVLRTVIDIRNSKGLITIMIYIGTEKEFKTKNFENRMTVPMYKYDITGIKVKDNTSKIIKKKQDNLDFDREESF